MATDSGIAGQDSLADAVSFEASCVALGDAGILLLGEPGVGKSDLALRLIDRGAMLVADGQVIVRREDGVLVAGTTPANQGRMKIHGMTEVELPVMVDAPLKLVVAVATNPPQGMPEAFECLGVSVPVVAVNPKEVSADVRIRAMLWNLNVQSAEG